MLPRKSASQTVLPSGATHSPVKQVRSYTSPGAPTSPTHSGLRRPDWPSRKCPSLVPGSLYRRPVGQDDRSRRPQGRRWGQEGGRPQAAPAGRYPGTDLGTGGPAGRPHRLGWGGEAVRAVRPVSASAGEGLGRLELPGGGFAQLDQGERPVGAGGGVQASGADDLRGAEVAVDRGADVRLVRPLPAAVQGL